MNYEKISLTKDLYKAPRGFSAALEALDPSKAYAGTELACLDAFQRQLKRFDIKVGGSYSDQIAKFFQTSESAALFPEYISRAVTLGTGDAGIIEQIIACKTDISSPDYRSITTDLDLDNDTYPDGIAEGDEIPETKIILNEQLVKLKKRGRLLKASYEAIKFQRVDVFTVALRQIGSYIAKVQLKDAVDVLIGDEDNEIPEAEIIETASTVLAYTDLLKLWKMFEDFEMNVMLASPDMTLDILSLDEFRDVGSGLNFQTTGSLSTPLGAKLVKTSAVPAGTIIALDRNYALEMVAAGGISVEYDKLIDSQLERAAVTSLSGFSKLFPDAVKVLKRK